MYRNLEIENFIELKLVYGKPEEDQDLAEFVLSNIEDKTALDEGITDAAKAVKEIVINGIDSAMNKFN